MHFQALDETRGQSLSCVWDSGILSVRKGRPSSSGGQSPGAADPAFGLLPHPQHSTPSPRHASPWGSHSPLQQVAGRTRPGARPTLAALLPAPARSAYECYVLRARGGGAGEGVVRGAGPCAPFPDPCLHVPAWGCCSLQRISVKLGSGEPRPASVLGSRPERSLPASLPSPPSWTAPPLSEEPDFTLHSGLRRPSVCNNRFPHPPSPERFAPQGSAQRLLWEASVSQF